MTSKNHDLPQRVKSTEGGTAVVKAVVKKPQCTKSAIA